LGGRIGDMRPFWELVDRYHRWMDELGWPTQLAMFVCVVLADVIAVTLLLRSYR
jgi:hypothetical protein